MTAAAADRWLTTTRWVVGVAFSVLSAVALGLWLGYRLVLPGEVTADEALREIFFGVAGATYGIVGLIILRGRPRHLVGWSFAALGLASALHGCGWSLAAWRGEPFADVAYPLLVLVAAGLLLFPTGRPPSTRWRWLMWAVGGAALLDIAARSIGGEALAVSEMVTIAVILGAFVSVLTRWRGAGPVERQQLKWLLTVAVLLGLELALIFALTVLQVDQSDNSHAWVGHLLVASLFAAIPVAMGVAISRYRLFDLDRLVSRTVLYALVLGVMVGVYALAGLALGLLLPIEGDLEVALATLAAAGASIPAARRIRRMLDRRFFRSRYDASQVIATFAAQLQHDVDLGRILDGAERAVESTLQPEAASIWLAGE